MYHRRSIWRIACWVKLNRLEWCSLGFGYGASFFATEFWMAFVASAGWFNWSCVVSVHVVSLIPISLDNFFGLLYWDSSHWLVERPDLIQVLLTDCVGNDEDVLVEIASDLHEVAHGEVINNCVAVEDVLHLQCVGCLSACSRSLEDVNSHVISLVLEGDGDWFVQEFDFDVCHIRPAFIIVKNTQVHNFKLPGGKGSHY